MLLAAAFSLALLAVPCPSGYDRACEAIPPEHWARVESVRIQPGKVALGSTRRDRPIITLRPYERGRDGTLKHEVGHVMFNTTPGALEAYRAAFWPDGEPLGEPCLPTKAHTRNYREDAAECYEAYLDNHGRLGDAKRERFLRAWFFAPSPRPGTP